MRRVLTGKWVVWHVVYVVCLAICFGAAWWQLSRAESATGDWQNWLYAVQWPLFAVIGTWGWARSIYLELHPPGADRPALLHDDDEGRVVHVLAPRQLTVRPAHDAYDDADDPSLAAYNARLAAMATAPTPEDRLHYGRIAAPPDPGPQP